MTLDGENKTGQDALPQDNAGQPSPGTESSPSSTEPKTYTEEEVNKRHAKLDKTIASLTRERDGLKQNLESTNSRLDDLQRRIDEAEAEGARDNPELLNLYQERKKLREEKAQLQSDRKKLEEERAAHEEELTIARETKREIEIWNIAKAHGVDANTLKEKCQKFNLTSDEQVEEMAQTLAGSKPAETTPRQPLKTDSNAGSGGAQSFTDVRFDKEAPSASDMIKKGLSKK